MSLIRKCHNQKPQTNPWHREEEPHNHHETPGRQTKQRNQLSLPAAGVTGNVLQWFKHYLSGWKQRVVLPGISTAWKFIKADVLQGSILGPLLVLSYINDIATYIGTNIRLFADDTSLYIIVDNPLVAAETLNADSEKISRWAATWLVTFKPNESIALLLSRKVSHLLHPSLFMENTSINEVEAHKHLGLYVPDDCS